MRTSVIICSFNPRAEFLSRVLNSLSSQTLSMDEWELIVVDNGSKDPIADTHDVSWHKFGRIIVEKETGLTPARIRGCIESQGDLIIYVDDDNVLDSHYIENAVSHFQKYPMIGAWSGDIEGEFEITPNSWLEPFYQSLAIIPVKKDSWGNSPGYSSSTPVGAGMCVRREVLQAYCEKVRACPLRGSLDRTGTSLISGGDTDIAWTAIDLGFGTGRFSDLKVRHLIPKERMTKEYIEKLYFSLGASLAMLCFLRPNVSVHIRPDKIGRLRDFVHFWRRGRFYRKVIRSFRAGERSMALRLKSGVLKN